MNIHPVVVGAFDVNCFLVTGDDGKTLIIDPGADANVILNHIIDENLEVTAYLLTHGHMDHISVLFDLYKVHSAPVAIHGKDLLWAFSENNCMPPFYDMPKKPSEISRILKNAESFSDGGLEYEIIETPGHTPGGVCFYFKSKKILFCGDTLFAGSVGRTDLPGGDSRVLSESLKRLADLPDDVTVYPGHGPSTTIGEEKSTNFFMRGMA